MENVYKATAAIAGAVVSFFTGIPVIMWVLIGVMSLDYVTGLLCAAVGKSLKTDGGGLSSTVAFNGLLKKAMILIVVGLSCLIDLAIASSAGLVSFHATAGAVCLWFVASEGVSILENAAEMGLPVPEIISQALEVMKGTGRNTENEQKN